jgi:hypothetical protein
MAFIYKRTESNTYQCAFYVTDPQTGERSKVRMSTGATNKKDAQQFADEQERHRKGVMVAGSDRAMRAKMLLAEGARDLGEGISQLASHIHIMAALRWRERRGPHGAHRPYYPRFPRDLQPRG